MTNRFGTPSGRATSNGLSIAAIVCGVVAIFFLPIIVGVIGIVLGAIALSRHEPLAKVGLGVAVAGTILGFVLGAVILSNNT